MAHMKEIGKEIGNLSEPISLPISFIYAGIRELYQEDGIAAGHKLRESERERERNCVYQEDGIAGGPRLQEVL